MTKAKPYPHSKEAEVILLGSLIADSRKLDEAAGLCSPEDCYFPPNEALYRLLLDMRRKGEHIDAITIPERVMRLGADRFGGLSYVVDIGSRGIPSAMAHHARQIRADAVRRRIIDVAEGLRERAFDATEEVGTIINEGAEKVIALGSQAGGRSWRPLPEVLDSLAGRKRDAEEGTGMASPTFFDALDRYIDGGLRSGRVYVLAARPAMGKTALALQFATAVGWGGGAVGLFSLEMDAEENADRWLRSYAETEVRRWPIFLDDQAGITIADIMARARTLQRQCANSGTPLRLIGIDYLQLVAVETRRNGTRAEAIGEVSRQVKVLARSLGVAVVLLAQVNRDCEKRDDKRPQVSDLKESGSIEQDADAVLMLYRDSYYNPGTQLEWDPVELLIGKNRQGPSGVMVPLLFNGRAMKFVEPDATADSPHGCARTKLAAVDF